LSEWEPQPAFFFRDDKTLPFLPLSFPKCTLPLLQSETKQATWLPPGLMADDFAYPMVLMRSTSSPFPHFPNLFPPSAPCPRKRFFLRIGERGTGRPRATVCVHLAALTHPVGSFFPLFFLFPLFSGAGSCLPAPSLLGFADQYIHLNVPSSRSQPKDPHWPADSSPPLLTGRELPLSFLSSE